MSVSARPAALPPIVSREEWTVARAELLLQEKALTRHKDQVSAARRRLPMVEITTPYTFDSESGPVSLLDLFGGRTQLIVQHFMFGADWTEGCVGCSMMADHIAPRQHLHARDTSLVLISRAPLGKLLAYRERMGWNLPWVSSAGTTFNEDFQATIDGNEETGISSFIRDGDRIFHTWFTSGRGVESMIGVMDLLDMTPYGRQEAWQDAPEGWPQGNPTGDWWQRHDCYEEPAIASCH